MSRTQSHAVCAGLSKYQPLEKQIVTNDESATLARWEFGHALLRERGGAKCLKKGRLAELANAFGRSTAELNNRMQFAGEYWTKAEAREAFRKYRSWYEICKTGLGRRGQSAQSEAEEESQGRIAEAYLRATDGVIAAVARAEGNIVRLRMVQSVILTRNNEVRAAMARLESELTAEEVAA